MRNYMKKNYKKREIELLVTEELDTTPVVEEHKPSIMKKVLLSCGAMFLTLPLLFTCIAMKETKNIVLGEEESITLASAPVSAAAGNKGIISIPTGSENPNPFLPYRDLSGKVTVENDVPTGALVAPPDSSEEASEAARIMDTTVSGILYDKYSPSAILNIEGNDYLVKKGDVVNNYKVLEIVPESVTVKLGENVYKAGIGEILTEGTLNHNDVSNLSNKFGGER